MIRPPTLALLAGLSLLLSWSGENGIERVAPTARVTATPVPLMAADRSRQRVGALTYLGGIQLTADDPGFGGYSSLTVAGDRFTLLSDLGGVLDFTLGADWRPRAVRFGDLPAGPRTGWTKRDRDSESMTVDPATGRVWVGFEQFNQIWRYGPGFAPPARGVAPTAMAGWKENGGIESMVRLRDGRFVAISETTRPPGGRAGRDALLWAGDPVAQPRPAFRFGYRPAPGFNPSDMTQLPDGRLLVLERRFQLPFRWSNRLVLVDPAAIRPGAEVAGREIAVLKAPLIHDNFEGVAAMRENGATILWLVSDDNQLPIQRTLLLKFRLEG